MHYFIQISQLLVLLAIYYMDLYLLFRYFCTNNRLLTTVLHSSKHELDLVFRYDSFTERRAMKF